MTTAAIDSATLLDLHRTMLTIRLFEQRVAREFRTGQIPGFVHMYIGEEAVAAGVCANLDDDDYVTSTHRGHGHCIAKGCDLARDDGRDLRPRGRALQGARRLDAHRRLLARHAGRERDRRRRHRPRDRRRARVERPRQRAGRGRLLRGRRGQPGRPPREPQPGGDLEAARDLRLREQRLRRVDARRVRDERAPTSRAAPSAYGIPGVVADGADVRDVYAAARSRGRARAGGRGADAARGQDVPLHRGHFEGDPDRYRDDEDRRTTQRARRARARCARSCVAAGDATEARARRAAGRARGRGRRRRRVRAREPVPRSRRARPLRLPRAARRRWRRADGRRDRAQALARRRGRRGDAAGDGGRPDA